MKEGEQGPRPNKKADGKPTKKRSIIKMHLHKKPNGHKSSNKQQREHNNRHGESFARRQRPDEAKGSDAGREKSQQAKEGGPREEREEGEARAAATPEAERRQTYQEAKESPGSEGTTAEGSRGAEGRAVTRS
ncbi:MAG TPA: hypothetical protein VGL47_26000 [Amycolatopsis sp.]|uniref:hypothetical protein n=1 Tax=Amycolatopsis sp. TaxID=37632 RepID=UPI002F3F1B84